MAKKEKPIGNQTTIRTAIQRTRKENIEEISVNLFSFLDENKDRFVEAFKNLKEPRDIMKYYTDVLRIIYPTSQDINVSAEKKNFNEDLRKMVEDFKPNA